MEKNSSYLVATGKNKGALNNIGLAVQSIISELGECAIAARVNYVWSRPLSEVFQEAYGMKVENGVAGASLKLSLSGSNKDIRKANKAGDETTRSRLIRILADAKFYGRAGTTIKSFEIAK